MNHVSSVSKRHLSSQFIASNQRHVVTRNRTHRSGLLEELESRVLLTVVGPATQLFIGLQPTNGFVNVSNGFALEVEVHDASGNLVNTDTSQMTITIASGPGNLSGTLSVNAVAGVADFTHFLFSQAGTYTLTVSDPGLASATSGAINIDAAPKATSLVFVQQPIGNPVGANVTPAVTVGVLDQFGNAFIAPTQVSLKMLTGPAKGKVSGTLHAKTVAGLATFSGVTVNAGGTFVIQAKDKSLTVNSNSFVMGGPPVATSLVFDQGPSNAVAGVANAPAITVQVNDQYGNLLATAHSSVKLTVATGPASKQSFSAPVKNGIATFTKVQYDTAGTYTLRAADGALPTVNSTSFVISAGAATRLAFDHIPANGSSASGPGDITVDVVDKFNNIVLTDTSTVSLIALVEPHGAAPLSTSVQAIGGVATFSGLVFPAPGKYILKASDNLLVSATSSSFILI